MSEELKIIFQEPIAGNILLKLSKNTYLTPGKNYTLFHNYRPNAPWSYDMALTKESDHILTIDFLIPNQKIFDALYEALGEVKFDIFYNGDEISPEKFFGIRDA